MSFFLRPPPRSPRGLRLCVVEDDPDLRDALVETLAETHRFQISTAADGDEALAVIRRSSPDIVLLDHRMPVMGGDEVVRRLDRHPCPPVIVMMSAGDSARQVASALGLDLWLSKPFGGGDLVSVLDRAALRRFSPR